RQTYQYFLQSRMHSLVLCVLLNIDSTEGCAAVCTQSISIAPRFLKKLHDPELTMANDPRPTASAEHFWMPFTANRQFKTKPRLLESAEGMYYTDTDGRQVLDGTAGLWCCNAGHGRRE